MAKVKKLKNGLRIIHAPIVGAKTATLLVMFKAGSKYEKREQNGLSHFLEHMFFKGSKKRPTALAIASELDSFGSENNAFTSKEYTGYWVKSSGEKIAQSAEVLADMLLNPLFDSEEINRERGVIIEELNMYQDMPREYAEDLFEACLYGDTPAGWEIIGTKDNIKRFTREDFLHYHSCQYGSENTVIVAVGALPDNFDATLENLFAPFQNSNFQDKLKVTENQNAPAIKILNKKTDQAHLVLGVRAFPVAHQDEMAVKALSVILGGSMSSRLFQELRDKRGLAYYVRTAPEFYTDSGYIATHAGVPQKKLKEAIEIILKEYQKIKIESVNDAELQKVKDLMRGRLVLNLEASDDIANWYAKNFILRGKVYEPKAYEELLERITSNDIKRVAEKIFVRSQLNLAVIGDCGEKEIGKEIFAI